MKWQTFCAKWIILIIHACTHRMYVCTYVYDDVYCLCVKFLGLKTFPFGLVYYIHTYAKSNENVYVKCFSYNRIFVYLFQRFFLQNTHTKEFGISILNTNYIFKNSWWFHESTKGVVEVPTHIFKTRLSFQAYQSITRYNMYGIPVLYYIIFSHTNFVTRPFSLKTTNSVLVLM